MPVVVFDDLASASALMILRKGPVFLAYMAVQVGLLLISAELMGFSGAPAAAEGVVKVGAAVCCIHLPPAQTPPC